jgi:hypothetical protein
MVCDGKSSLPDLTIGSDVVRRVDIAVVDLTSGYKLIDFDCPSALDFYGVEFFILNNEVLSLADFVAARCVLSGNCLAGL